MLPAAPGRSDILDLVGAALNAFGQLAAGLGPPVEFSREPIDRLLAQARDD